VTFSMCVEIILSICICINCVSQLLEFFCFFVFNLQFWVWNVCVELCETQIR
jgi:hypothetical protein